MPPPETSIAPGLAAHAAAGARALLVQAAAHDWRGPDPYDGLYFRWPAWLTAGRRRRQVIVQAHARAPVDIRRLYRRTHPQIAKALGVFGSVGMRLARGGDRDAAALALAALDLLDGDRTGGSVAWGYPFDVQTRWSFYPAGSPNVVVTSFAVEALLEGAAAADRPRLKARAVGAAQWVLDELWVQRDGFFAYHPTADVNIHNANLLGAVCVHHALGSDPAARECVEPGDRTHPRRAGARRRVSLRRRSGPCVARLVSHGVRPTLPGGDGHDRSGDRRGRSTWRRRPI